jgi:hypothetical protein
LAQRIGDLSGKSLELRRSVTVRPKEELAMRIREQPVIEFAVENTH